jgi:S-formylglutathione hydrolase FrmB
MASILNRSIVVWAVLITTQFVIASDPVVHHLSSKRQSATVSVRVLMPDHLPTDGELRLPVVYVLPVEAGEGVRWGDSLAEVQKHDLQNKHNVVCVFPSFSDLPWYADHPENPQLQQEAFLLQDVLSLVEQNHPVRSDREGRLLVGFSKSGWGAWSLLLRHPGVFRRAAAFDAPLMMDAPGKYGSGPIFGTAENFRQYQITNLLERRAATLQGEPSRLMLIGQGHFQPQHLQIHDRLESAMIPHTWIVGVESEHSWHSGWLSKAFEWLTRTTP